MFFVVLRLWTSYCVSWTGHRRDFEMVNLEAYWKLLVYKTSANHQFGVFGSCTIPLPQSPSPNRHTQLCYAAYYVSLAPVKKPSNINTPQILPAPFHYPAPSFWIIQASPVPVRCMCWSGQAHTDSGLG